MSSFSCSIIVFETVSCPVETNIWSAVRGNNCLLLHNFSAQVPPFLLVQVWNCWKETRTKKSLHFPMNSSVQWIPMASLCLYNHSWKPMDDKPFRSGKNDDARTPHESLHCTTTEVLVQLPHKHIIWAQGLATGRSCCCLLRAPEHRVWLEFVTRPAPTPFTHRAASATKGTFISPAASHKLLSSAAPWAWTW